MAKFPSNFKALCLVIIFAVTCTDVIHGQDAEDNSRSPIPEKAARYAKRKEIESVFDVALVVQSNEKKELVAQLLTTAEETDNDLVARFVMFNMAREISLDLGDIASSLKAISAIGRDYEFDVFKLRLAAIQ
ncbi:MAG: hypothetical protein AAF483_21090 [Planctomycetota bacterium]